MICRKNKLELIELSGQGELISTSENEVSLVQVFSPVFSDKERRDKL
jgi:hypothetical protein